MKHIIDWSRVARHVCRAAPALSISLLLPLAACDLDSLLEVEDPDVATPETVRDPDNLPVVVAGVLSDFSIAYGGSGETSGGSSGEGQIHLSGMLGDEFIATGTFGTRIQIDRRAIPETGGVSDNSGLEEAYQQLHDARVAAENGAILFAEAGVATDPQRALLFNLAGFTYNFFGENYCSGVPYSTATLDGEFVYGPPTPTNETFQRAIARFDSALAIVAGDTTAAAQEEANLARVGKARALLNLGDFSGAAAVAAEVPTDFVRLIFYSENTPAQENGVWHYAQENGRYGVTDVEGGEGLPYRSAVDPRVPWFVSDRETFDASLPFPYFAENKYETRAAEIPLATGIEARLIEAEALLNMGESAAYLPILQQLRDFSGLEFDDPLTDPGTPAGRVDQFFQERAFWLWLTSHRLGDMRRLVRQYGRPAEEVFPSGDYFRPGLTYGDDKNLPIYQTELQNPEFTGCTSRDA